MGVVIPGPESARSGARRVPLGGVRRRGGLGFPPPGVAAAGRPYAAFDPAPWMMTLAVLAASCSVFDDRWA